MEQLKTEMNNTREWCYNTRRRRAFIKDLVCVVKCCRMAKKITAH